MHRIPNKPPVWVNSKTLLKQAVEDLGSESCLSVDTESNSLFAYREKVCLIQISSPQTDYLIDPFVFDNLDPLESLFNNPKQEKIFHASEYDLLCLKRDFSFSFENLFDTMIAARILGFAQVGLGSLLEQFFGICLDKKYQRANWGMRPLPAEMLDYARLDTFYLFDLRDCLAGELAGRGLGDLAREDFINACFVEPHENGNHRTGCWKVAGAHKMAPRQTTILNELCNYRDEQARKADLPLFKVLSNDLLIAISLQPPNSLEELSALPHCSEKIVKRHGTGLLNAVEKGISAELIVRQRSPRPDDAFLERLESLKVWRKQLAKTLEVESDVVLPRDLVEKIAALNPHDLPHLQKIMANTPVRFEKYGVLILTTLNPKEA